MIEIMEWNFENLVWLFTFAAGLYLILSFAYMIVTSCIACHKKMPTSLIERYGKGTWALVTGASKGIGLEYSRRLAKEGFNVIMTARSYSLMEKYAKEIEKENNVKVKVITLDASSQSSINEVIKAVENYDISVFVNNAGIEYRRSFVNAPIESLENVFEVNLCAPISFFKFFEKKASQRETRSAFIVVSSISAIVPEIYDNLYSPTKSFISRYFEKVKYNKKLDLLVAEYGLVSTEMVPIPPVPGIILDTGTVVKYTLRSLGLRNQTFGGFVHYMQHWLITMKCIFVSYTFVNSIIAKKTEAEKSAESQKKKTE